MCYWRFCENTNSIIHACPYELHKASLDICCILLMYLPSHFYFFWEQYFQVRVKAVCVLESIVRKKMMRIIFHVWRLTLLKIMIWCWDVLNPPKLLWGKRQTRYPISTSHSFYISFLYQFISSFFNYFYLFWLEHYSEHKVILTRVIES